MKAQKGNVIISHPNADSAFLLRLFFVLHGFAAETASDPEDAVSRSSSTDCDAILLCDASDETLIRTVRKSGSDVVRKMVVVRDSEQPQPGAEIARLRTVRTSEITTALLDAVSELSGKKYDSALGESGRIRVES